MNAGSARELTYQKVEENVRNAITDHCLKGLFVMDYESKYLTKETVDNLVKDGFTVKYEEYWSLISWK